MCPSPFQPPFVLDEQAYRSKLQELETAAKQRGRPQTLDEIMNRSREASAYGYSTEFSKICTAAIRGDWEPAKERCRKERDQHGEDVARELMRSYQRAVNNRKRMLRIP